MVLLLTAIIAGLIGYLLASLIDNTPNNRYAIIIGIAVGVIVYLGRL